LLPRPLILTADRVIAPLPWTAGGKVGNISIGLSLASAEELVLGPDFQLEKYRTKLKQQALISGSLRLSKNQKSSLAKKKDDVISVGEKFNVVQSVSSKPGCGMRCKYNV
jgi:hypothetical protein